MRFIPTLVHGVADYIVGLIVIGLPFLLELQGFARWFLIALSGLTIFYSMMTDYELGAVRFLRIRFHLLLDTLFGVIMLASPWLLDFPPGSRWAGCVIGVLALVLVATTRFRASGTATPLTGQERSR